MIKYSNNLLIGYLKINLLRKKTIDVSEVIEKLSLDNFFY